MVYLVTNSKELFENEAYSVIDLDKCLSLLQDMPVIQIDSETDGRDAHINKLLCIQFGSEFLNCQIVVDAATIPVTKFKEILESKYLIFQNGKFDLQFLYNYGIHPTKVYDTMIVEQFLHLGYPGGLIVTEEEYRKRNYDFPYHKGIDDKTGETIYTLSYALDAIADRRIGIHISKEVRSQIIWRGLDTEVIKYAAGDVTYLERIMKSQLADIRKIPNGLIGAKIECDFIPAIAYLEWCGIKLDEDRWKEKMKNDKENLEKAIEELNTFVAKTPVLKDYTFIDRQGDLFSGFDLTPKVKVNWSSSQQVVKIARLLGFNTTVQDKTSGEDKDSVLEKYLKGQKGINDEFLDLYFNYQEYAKVVSSFGQGHLNAVNPVTGRIHTVYRQLGASSGRLSCGSNQPNTDLAKYKGITAGNCCYPNIQQLPSDAETRRAFVAPEGYKFVSADFSAEESRLGADIYQDKEFLKEFTEGSGDTHSMFAWIVYRKECEECGCKCVGDVKKLAPKWRKKVKGYEFGWMFGAAAPTLAQSAGSTVEEAQDVIDKLEKGFSGVSEFARKGSRFVRANGYIVINPRTGHRMYWWDWNKWKERQASFTPEFWDDYRINHKGTGDSIAMEVRQHFQAASKYDRLARNSVTQGTGSIIMKTAMTNLLYWIIDNSYFGKIHICASVHDEICCDYPQEIKEFPKILENIMEQAAAKFCKSLPIPAEAEVADCWKH